MKRDEQGRLYVDLQEGWQEGPASITLEVDEIVLDEGHVDDYDWGLLLHIATTTNADTEAVIGLGVGTLSLPKGQGGLDFTLAASREQATELRNALSHLLDGSE